MSRESQTTVMSLSMANEPDRKRNKKGLKMALQERRGARVGGDTEVETVSYYTMEQGPSVTYCPPRIWITYRASYNRVI